MEQNYNTLSHIKEEFPVLFHLIKSQEYLFSTSWMYEMSPERVGRLNRLVDFFFLGDREARIHAKVGMFV
jgi:hypothetical protein